MKRLIAFFLFITFFSCKKENTSSYALLENDKILSYTLNPKKQDLKFYWKSEEDSIIKTFKNLKNQIASKNKILVFAMNGGMFKKDFSPQGLYIEKGETITNLDTLQNGYGNFYLQPNGVFYLTKSGHPKISTSSNFKQSPDIKYATQSGPMLVISSEIHSKFNKGSSNLNIRNGVGILPNGDLLFAMSKEKINFYDFATFFKKNGCRNALYLDGFVSKTYLPSKNWKQLDGNFGVIIAETKSIQ